MYDGIYSFEFVGAEGHGYGMIVADNGKLYGSDGIVSYDGTYRVLGNRMVLNMTLTVPAGAKLVTAIPVYPEPYRFDVAIEVNAGGSTSGQVTTPAGPVQVKVDFLRTLPDIAA